MPHAPQLAKSVMVSVQTPLQEARPGAQGLVTPPVPPVLNPPVPAFPLPPLPLVAPVPPLDGPGLLPDVDEQDHPANRQAAAAIAKDAIRLIIPKDSWCRVRSLLNRIRAKLFSLPPSALREAVSDPKHRSGCTSQQAQVGGRARNRTTLIDPSHGSPSAKKTAPKCELVAPFCPGEKFERRDR